MARIDGLLTTAQVAERLNKPIGTINRWATEGKLPVAYQLPGRTGAKLFDPADVDTLLDEAAS